MLCKKVLESNRHAVIKVLLMTILLPLDIIIFIVRLFFFTLKWGSFTGVYLAILLGLLLHPKYVEYCDYADEVVKSVSDFGISESSKVYNVDGELIAILRDGAYQEYLSYEDIPEDVINAFVAVEDRTFWENDGVDYKGILRVIYRAILSKGDELHGASTITQQLVRNNFLTREVRLERKIKEILIARRLTEKLTKEQIMEYYINNIGYGNGIEGIVGAAWGYFGKSVNDLSLSQIAYVCAIPNAPTYYDPYGDYTRAIKRRDKILEDMFECGYISEAKMKEAKAESIEIKRGSISLHNYETTYAVDCAIRYLMKLDGFEFQYQFETASEYESYHKEYAEVYETYRGRLYNDGYRIYTSLDSGICGGLQEILDTDLSFSDEVSEDGTYAFQGALTVVDNETGRVVALVGGRSQDTQDVYGFNRAYQAYRQPGSTMKPIIVYMPALWSNYTPESELRNIDANLVVNSEVVIEDLDYEIVDLRTAVENSINGTAVYTFDKVGVDKGMDILVSMHYQNLHPDDWRRSSALGGFTKGVSTVEQAGAYRTLQSGGSFIQPTCLVSILDRDGNKIYNEPSEKSIWSRDTTDQMVDILKGVLTNGTGSKLNWYDYTDEEAWGKTGTTNDNKDGWFCGSTNKYTIAVWVGYDMPREMSELQGASYPGEIWRDSMLYLLK